MEASYNSERPGASGQGAQWVFGTNKFTDEDHARIQEALNSALSWDQINSRPGGGGKKVHYLAGHTVIENANKIFGFAGWDSSILHLSVDYVEKTEDGKFWTAAATAIVRVALSNGSGHEDVGNAHLKDRDKGEVLERAKKAAVTDATKRAMRLFGPHLGGSMSNKEGLKDVERNYKQNQRELKANLQKEARERAAEQQQQQQQQQPQQQQQQPQQQQHQQQQQQQLQHPQPQQQQQHPPPRPQQQQLQHPQPQQQQQHPPPRPQQQQLQHPQPQQQQQHPPPRPQQQPPPPRPQQQQQQHQQQPNRKQQQHAGAHMPNRSRTPQQQQQPNRAGSTSFTSPQRTHPVAAATRTHTPPPAAAVAAAAATGATCRRNAFSPRPRPQASGDGAQGLPSASKAPPMPREFNGSVNSGSSSGTGGVITPGRCEQPLAFPVAAPAIVSGSFSAAPVRAGRGALSECSPNHTTLGRCGGGGCGVPVFEASGTGDATCGGSVGGGRGGGGSCGSGNGGGHGGVTEAPVQCYQDPAFDYTAAAVMGGSDSSTATACAAPAQAVCAAAIESGSIDGGGGTDVEAAAMEGGAGRGGDEFDLSQDFESAFLEIDSAIQRHTTSSLSGGSVDGTAYSGGGGGATDSILAGPGVEFGGPSQGVDCGSGDGSNGGGGIGGHEAGGQTMLQQSSRVVAGAGHKRLRTGSLPQPSS